MNKAIVLAEIALTLVLGGAAASPLAAQESAAIIPPEQRHIAVRDPACLPRTPLRPTPPPHTVNDPFSKDPWAMSLDDAVRIAIDNAKALRRLAGQNVVASGRTIYDPAIQNTQIDQARARFDPTLQFNSGFGQVQPNASYTFPNQFTLPIAQGPVDVTGNSLTVQKQNELGGAMQFGVSQQSASFRNDPVLRSLDQPTVTFGYKQPLLQGAGEAANMAPIVIAQIQTEYSFFQTKDATQDLVRSVIEAYWNLVYARIDAWARRQQVEQGEEALRRADAQLQVGIGTAAEVAQARSSLAGFRAALIGAQGNMLQREDALRNLLGLPPSDVASIVPTTPPAVLRLQTQWNDLLELAGMRRPDLVELQLVLQADTQQTIIADNQAMPQLNAVAGLAWNGLTGTLNSGSSFDAEGTGWGLGINFSVPLGLRQGRANLRQKQLLLAADRVNLDQARHAAEHDLAISYRALTQYYEQYLAFKETAEASRINLEQQLADFQLRRGSLYLNVLQAITEWGNAVSSEAQSLALYNVELANLEARTGTILETHGVYFYEDRFCAIGPLGRLGPDRAYPLDTAPRPGAGMRYPPGPQLNGTEYTPPEGTVPQRLVPPSNESIPAPTPQPPEPPVAPTPDHTTQAPAVWPPGTESNAPWASNAVPAAENPAAAQPAALWTARVPSTEQLR